MDTVNPPVLNELLQKLTQMSSTLETLDNRLGVLEKQNNQAERSNEQVTLEHDDFVPDHLSGKDDSEYQDQLSIMVSPVQGFDISCPIPLDCNYGHGDGPTTSKSLDPVHNTNNVDEATIPQPEASGKALPHDSEPEKVQLFNPTAESPGWNPSEGFKEFLNTNFRRNLSSSQIFTILEETALPDMEVFLNSYAKARQIPSRSDFSFL